MIKKSLLWKIPVALMGVALGFVLLLLIAGAGVVLLPSARQAVIDKAVEIANEQTDLDIDVGGLYLSPLHHSPLQLYRAYKGKADLPLRVEVDSLFVGHRGQDTLIYVHSLRLKAQLKTGGFSLQDSGFTALPIAVESLHLDGTTFHSDSLIAALGIDAIVGNLDVSSPELIIAKGQYPLHGLRLDDAYVGISLRDAAPDTTAQDAPPMPMAFDVPDGELSNIHFALNPPGMHIRTDRLSTNVLADVGGNLYDARRLDVDNISLTLGNLHLPFDTLYGEARVDLNTNLITSKGLHVRSDELGAQADLSATMMDLGTMRLDVAGDAEYQGSKARLRAMYDIDDETYDAHVEVERVDLSPFVKDSLPIVVAGDIDAVGKGIDPNSRKMHSKVSLHLTDGIYDNIDVSGLRLNAELANQTVTGSLHLPVRMTGEELRVSGQTEHRFRVAEFMKPEQMEVDYHGRLRHVRAHVGGEDFAADSLSLVFATADSTSLNITTRGVSVDVQTPMHVLRLVDKLQPLLQAVGDSAVITPITNLSDLTMIDTLRRLVPDIQADIVLTPGSPVQHIIDRMGLAINEVALSLRSDAEQTALTADASIPTIDHPEDSTALRLPAAKAGLRVALTEGKTDVTLTADSKINDGAMNMHDLSTDASLRFDLAREGRQFNGKGRLTLDSLRYGNMVLGSRAIDMQIAPSQAYAGALRADVLLDDIPLDIVESIIRMDDIDLEGAVRATATADGLPYKTDLSASVLPLNVSALYKPYSIKLGLGETPITMEHNKVALNGLPIYGVDSSYLALTGGLDLDSMRLNVTLAADSFAPVKLVKDGPIPVHGDFAADIQGSVSGPLDSIVADVGVTILPVTDITYQIDKKNLAQVKPHGRVNVRYAVADGSLDLGGRVNVDEGFIRYSPKAYPIMPFHVDSGSHIAFNGPVGQTMVDVSASQKVKSSTQAEGEDSRMVDFTTGVRVRGTVDSLE